MDAIVLAGGRVTGPYAETIGTTVKALAPVAGTPVLRRVVDTIREAEVADRICVVGPDEVRSVLGDAALFQPETETALGNLLAGLERLGAAGDRPILLSGSDLPVLTPEAVEDFIRRSSPDADVSMSIVSREEFLTVFPGEGRPFVRLVDGFYTGGSQFLLRARTVLENRALLERLFLERKSQLGMARTFGPILTLKFLLGRLRIPDLETRASQLTGCVCRAVSGCRPELAFDIDSFEDLRYAEGWHARGGGPGGVIPPVG